jgi:exoribonuclease R
MKALCDPTNALGTGLDLIRTQYQVPKAFPADVLAAAEHTAGRAFTEHVDRTDIPFVTLDPAASVDLDQAFHIERSSNELVLRYAIADIAWFVDEAIDAEAWRRGQTLYFPDGKVSLYPPVLSEGAASLLPGKDYPAIVFTVRVAPDGEARLDGAERAIVRSRAKLAYDTVTNADLPDGFEELSGRIAQAELRRGAARVDPPEQEVAPVGNGCYALRFRPKLQSEMDNAALSLATNLAIAEALLAHCTGLFRVMPEPDKRAVKRLRHTATALGIAWPAAQSLVEIERTLNPADPRQAAFMLAIRRASRGAAYVPYRDGIVPWHAAMAATYAQATAPLRRLADRYVVLAALAVANGQSVPEPVAAAFEQLPTVMSLAEARAAQVERAVVDLAEAVMLHDKKGQVFPAIVTDVDERGIRFQLTDLPVAARMPANHAVPGDAIQVRLLAADPVRRETRFELA